MPNVMRPTARGGVALVGDAALATDPLFGVGLSWAFQSADWLAEQTTPALLEDGELDAALERYRRVFRRRLGLHHYLIADYSTGRKMYPWERVLYRAGAADQDVARAFDEVGSRRHSPLRMLDPRFTRDVARALTHRRRAT